MRLLKTGDVIDTEELGVSDETAGDWIAAGFAEHFAEPEPIEAPVKSKKRKKAIEAQEVSNG